MQHIFRNEDYTLILNRINGLAVSDERRWGVMSLPQMLAHCSIQLQIALGRMPSAKPEGPFIYRTVLGRWLTLYVVPWPRGTATPTGMNMQVNKAGVENVETAKELLLHLLAQVQEQESFSAHPFFGQLSKKEWGRLIWKHLDHHLRQFGK